MAGEETTNQNVGNIKQEFNTANTGLNLDLTVNQVPKGALTYALNASVENFDASAVNYQNEPGNELCLNFPEGYQLIGEHSIYEKNKHIFFLANPATGDSEIGYMDNNDCVYHTLVNAVCLNFNINHPIHKVVHKITNCTTEIYWTDGFNSRRYLDIDNIPYTQSATSEPCDQKFTTELDCNAIKLQPNFSIPQLKVVSVNTGGELTAGAYQFAVQYSDATGNGYSSYYSVTNPTPIADTQVTSLNFNYNVGKSIDVQVSNLETKGQWQYFNLAVIKTVNGITSAELVGTYFIDEVSKQITYTGQNQTQIKLTIEDIFEKFPYYEIAQDLTAVRDILVWDQLTSIDQVNYQKIASQITLQWQTYKIPANENYSDELNATNLRGYLRDEVYAFEIVFLLKNGKQTDGFHIPGRVANANDLELIYPTNADFIGNPDPITGGSPTWKIYNTATVIGDAIGNPINNATPYKYGNFAYWESTETYPCNAEVWGDLANTPIRHHKFPDVLVSPIIESTLISSPNDIVMQNDSVFPIGVKVDLSQIATLIESSDLSIEQKANIEGFKIVRGDRGTNKSIVAKGILRNVGKYNREGTDYYYPNYPYNDLRPDPFLLKENNAFTTPTDENSSKDCRNFTVKVLSLPNGCEPFVIEFTDCFTNTTITKQSTTVGEEINFCSTDLYPRIIAGEGCLKCNTYKVYEFEYNDPELCPYLTTFTYNPPFNLQVNPEQLIVGPEFGGQFFIPCVTDECCDACNPPVGGDTVICTSPQFGSPFTETFGYPRCKQLMYSMTPPVFVSGIDGYKITEVESYGQELCFPTPLDSFVEEDLKYRQIFNSPETSFGQPFLGDVLKLESVIYGAGKAHFVQVKDNAKYKLISKEAQQDAINSANDIGKITSPFNASAFFSAYQAYLTIYINGITRRNYGWSFNSIAGYDYSNDIDNEAIGSDGFLGIKQREIDIAKYLIPGVQSVGDNNNVNNYQRESSVYIKTKDEDKTLARSYITYRICNTNVVPDTQIFEYTDISTGLLTTTPDITEGNCLDVDSYTYPTQVSGNNIFGITEISAGEQLVTGPTPPLLFPDDTPSVSSGGIPFIVDNSRFTLSSGVPSCNTKDVIADCNNPGQETNINVISYYASMKNIFPNQWGQIYSYDTIDTGFQRDIKPLVAPVSDTVFGGDTFISRFTFKTKLPFFIDNTVNSPDDRDIYFDEIGNVAYPKYWFSSRSVLSNAIADSGSGITLTNFISVKAHNLDCPNNQGGEDDTTIAGRTYYDGKMYLFAYGVPSFYCESSYNLDLRQAFNNKEGDFWPHVSTGIPDDWVQESNVSIAQDNTYYYNVTFSKQNKENFFSHLPVDYTPDLCSTFFPFRAIYSEEQTADADNNVNNWLIYRAVSRFDFPQNYGKLVSLDGIQNKAVLARFENKSLLYNTLLTINTSNPQAAYIGNPTLFTSAPPIDFAETDLGYVGSQNKMLLKIPQGQITVDAKRGQVFLVAGNQVKDLSAFGSGMNKFFTNNLEFEILKYFPEVDTDNHFTGIGLHGTYDSKYDRVIITKLDYTPKRNDIKYDPVTKEFYIEHIYPGNCGGSSTTTTTSSSTSTTTSSSSTTTTTTIGGPTTTTTTTVCVPRPSGLLKVSTVYNLGYDGIDHDINAATVSEACGYWNEFKDASFPVNISYKETEYASLAIGEPIYYLWEGNPFYEPCRRLEDGVHLLYPSDTGNVFNYFRTETSITIITVTGGVISAIDTCNEVSPMLMSIAMDAPLDVLTVGTTTTCPPIIIRETVYLTDEDYFCNKSWTVSYSANTGTWTSFHSYLPNFYIAENNFFYSGLNDCCSTINAIVAEVLPEPTTTSTSSTTTTSTSSTSTTSTTTTRFAGCDLEGIAEVYNCDLYGTALDITPTTTTTTTTVILPEIAAIVFFSDELGCTATNNLPIEGRIYLPANSNWFTLNGSSELVLDNQCPFPPLYTDRDFVSTGDFPSFTVSSQSVSGDAPIYGDGTYVVNATSLLDPTGPNIILTISGTNAVYSVCPCPTTTTTTTTIVPTTTTTTTVCVSLEYTLESTGDGATFAIYPFCIDPEGTTITLSGVDTAIVCSTQLPTVIAGTGSVTLNGPCSTTTTTTTVSPTTTTTTTSSGVTVYYEGFSACSGESVAFNISGYDSCSGTSCSGVVYNVAPGTLLYASNSNGPKAIGLCTNVSARIGTTAGGDEIASDSNIGTAVTAEVSYTVTSGSPSVIYLSAGLAS